MPLPWVEQPLTCLLIGCNHHDNDYAKACILLACILPQIVGHLMLSLTFSKHNTTQHTTNKNNTKTHNTKQRECMLCESEQHGVGGKNDWNVQATMMHREQKSENNCEQVRKKTQYVHGHTHIRKHTHTHTQTHAHAQPQRM